MERIGTLLRRLKLDPANLRAARNNAAEIGSGPAGKASGHGPLNAPLVDAIGGGSPAGEGSEPPALTGREAEPGAHGKLRKSGRTTAPKSNREVGARRTPVKPSEPNGLTYRTHMRPALLTSRRGRTASPAAAGRTQRPAVRLRLIVVDGVRVDHAALRSNTGASMRSKNS